MSRFTRPCATMSDETPKPSPGRYGRQPLPWFFRMKRKFAPTVFQDVRGPRVALFGPVRASVAEFTPLRTNVATSAPVCESVAEFGKDGIVSAPAKRYCPTIHALSVAMNDPLGGILMPQSSMKEAARFC